jgi:hypothetical protein
MIFRIYHDKRGGHVHMRFFSGRHDGAMGKCGDLCMRADEFDVFREMHPNIQFRAETDPHERLIAGTKP